MQITVPFRALVIAHLFYCVAPAGEADYTLDDSFWNEESPVGEVERLLKEYRQNQELVRRIGGHYYQIIYPVQLRHHEKMGISTREVSAPKPGQRPRPHDDGGFSRSRTKRPNGNPTIVFGELFDVTNPEGIWLSMEDKKFYAVQTSTKGDVGYSTAKEMIIHPSKAALLKKKVTTALVPDINLSDTTISSLEEDTEFYASSDDESYEPRVKKVTCSTKAAVKMVQTSNVSTRNAAKICKELLKSGIDIPTPSQSGVYKASIKAAERMEEKYMATLKEENWCMHFDGKKYGKNEVQVVVLTNEFKEVRLAVMKLHNGQSLTIFEGINKILHKFQLWNSIKMIICDTTNVNTGKKNGIVHLLQRSFQEKSFSPPQYVGCQHHVLDLILKHVMNEMLVAKSTSPNISYEIFTELITEYENLKQNFKQSDIILEKHRIKWRDDMQYLFELGQAFKYYEKNNLFPFIKFRVLPALSNARWNSRAILALLTFILKPEHRTELLTVCQFICSAWYDIWFSDQRFRHNNFKNLETSVKPFKNAHKCLLKHWVKEDSAILNLKRTNICAERAIKKHFHRTSLLIKAFNHKFRLDLELNSQLLSPNLIQKHYHSSGYLVDGNRHDIEHCYYHGTVKDYPGASAAFHTCNGVSGVIHIGNETFVIHPFYGGDLSKHPHVIFEARTKANKGCANSGNLDSWRLSRRTKHLSAGIIDEVHPNGAGRYKRDVREATKYIETAIIVDKAMFDKRNGSTRAEVIHDAIQVANIADLYFRTMNTRVSVVYIETWGKNQAVVDGSKDISKAISNFNDYTSRNLFQVERDTTQLLTGETFAGGEAGMAVPDTVCTPRAVGISVDINVYEPHLLAGTMAHMIGHNIGMGHDDGREECFCRDWHGCIMAQSIVGQENVQPYKFSECSKKDYIDALRTGHGLCLLNKPNEPTKMLTDEVELQDSSMVEDYVDCQLYGRIEMRRNCGNKIVEEDEECDCGTFEECALDPCCDGITCKLKSEAQCAMGACCDQCRLRSKDHICRDSHNECDLPEYCDGDSGECPMDVFKKNGSPCGHSKSGVSGYCFQGDCPTLNLQCEAIWGYGGAAADKECFEQFNSKGSINGHCGRDGKDNFVKCEPENVQCGTLQCKEGERQPVNEGDLYSRTIISIKGLEYECKATSGQLNANEYPDHGLVKDGTPCGDNLVCLNQTCVSIFPHVDQTKCPTNKQGQECSERGVCTNTNKCFCDMGWGGIDCSLIVLLTTPLPTEALPTPENTIKMEKKETPYASTDQDRISTLSMVIILTVIVKCVFISFATLAVCYRRKTTTLKYDPPYTKKPMTKAYGSAVTAANHHSTEEVSPDGSNKLVYANQPGFSRDKSIHSRRYTGSDDDQTHSEKGILKKHGYGLVHGVHDDGQSDNLELITQDGTLASSSGAAVSEVERTLKSLNGYHEDILEALRNAASHRGTGTGNTPVGSGSLSEEMLRKTLQECASAQLGYTTEPYKRSSGSKTSSRENICDQGPPHALLVETSSMGGPHVGPIMHHHRSQHQLHQPLMQQQPPPDEEDAPATGPLRIRNLEDLIRQLEHHSSRHMSPSGSEDIRISETEADRHYRLDSSAACSESSQGSNQQLAQSQKTATIHPSYSSRCRPRADEESRFSYGRYRHPTTTSRHPSHQSHSPHAFGHHAHHSHAHGHATHGPHSSHHSSHTHLHQDDDGIYESADHHDRQMVDTRLDPREVPDSESDDFIQAQQQLARWASEDVVSVVVMEPPLAGTTSDSQQSSGGGGHTSGAASTNTVIHHQHPHQHHGDHPSSAQATSTTTVSAAAAAAGSINAHMNMGAVPNGIAVNQRDYYPSPPSTETESSGSVIQPLNRRYTIQGDTSQQQLQLHQLHQHQHQSHQQQQQHQLQQQQQQLQMQGDTTTSSSNNSQSGQIMENGRYPEYKH